jgi:hypothetical protein
MFALRLAQQQERERRERIVPNVGPTVLLAGRPKAKKQWNLTPPPAVKGVFSERFLSRRFKT